jgi:signal transduction histidine kinase
MEQDDSTITSPEVGRILLGATDKIHKMVTFTTEYKDLGTHLPVWTNLYDAFQSARSSIDAAGVQITPEPACQELELFCDPMLTKVFHQLIDNSLRHGKTVSEISLLWKQENGGATIVCEDNGTGIADSVKPTLFQRGNGKKTGYGMFLVHEILAISGFTITETGTTGKGVRFEIVVPAGSFRVVKKKQQ